mmetsp:Transcript_113607/g.317300  ORF Transcript_113607/g.317300 Transcript_113607/m.317300 type:complete len:338 (-) Transcript_113607:27-1040(-)
MICLPAEPSGNSLRTRSARHHGSRQAPRAALTAKPKGSTLPATRLKACMPRAVNPFKPQRRRRCGVPKSSALIRHRSSSASASNIVAFSVDSHSNIFGFVSPCIKMPLAPSFSAPGAMRPSPCAFSQPAKPFASSSRKRARLATKHVVLSCSKRLEVSSRKQQRLPLISSGSTSESYHVTPAQPSICKHFSAQALCTCVLFSSLKSRHQPPAGEATPKSFGKSSGLKLRPSQPWLLSKLGAIMSSGGLRATVSAQTLADLCIHSMTLRRSPIRLWTFSAHSSGSKSPNNRRLILTLPPFSVVTCSFADTVLLMYSNFSKSSSKTDPARWVFRTALMP